VSWSIQRTHGVPAHGVPGQHECMARHTRWSCRLNGPDRWQDVGLVYSRCLRVLWHERMPPRRPAGRERPLAYSNAEHATQDGSDARTPSTPERAGERTHAVLGVVSWTSFPDEKHARPSMGGDLGRGHLSTNSRAISPANSWASPRKPRASHGAFVGQSLPLHAADCRRLHRRTADTRADGDTAPRTAHPSRDLPITTAIERRRLLFRIPTPAEDVWWSSRCGLM